MNKHIWWAWALKNSVAIACWTILAIYFNKWWIALFAALFLLRTERMTKMETKLDTVTCPVCGKVHEIKHPLLNIICDCGAKYYGKCEIWLDRKTGKHYAR